MEQRELKDAASISLMAEESSATQYEDFVIAAKRMDAGTIGKVLTHGKELDGMNFGEIMSVLSTRRVLILGRFTARRLKVLEARKMHLQKHPNNYIPELFTYDKPALRSTERRIRWRKRRF